MVELKDSENRDEISSRWQQGELIEVTIADLNDTGEGVGRFGGRVVFVPDTVTGDRVLARLLRVKPQYAAAKLETLLHASPHRIRPRCIVADKCGGCQWQHVSDEYQQQAKRDRVVQALTRIGGFDNPPVAPILTAASSLNYRNKATYPLGINAAGNVQAGYYRTGTHQIVNLNQCPVQDARLNPLLADLKQEIQQAGWSIYDERTHRGQLRHLSLRVGRRTGEILATLVSTERDLPELGDRARAWMQRYPALVGVALNLNSARTNVIFGEETRCIAGRIELREVFAGLEFDLRPETFFQVNTEAAEALLEVIFDRWTLQGDEFLLDAYCGIGTFTLPLAQRCGRAVGIEVQAASVQQARHNAELNAIANVEFLAGTVESQIAHLDAIPDLVLLDPPRKGCDRAVLEALLALQPARIACVSCKPATLARDLRLLCQSGQYRLVAVQPADFFPQTTHVESVAFLEAQFDLHKS
ncbi:23S rRNA (uracil(1939)-C(5))-methyltransferase RlmD [Oscillatoria sp. FACHB-1406]|uniref:23S rRNA (uracil(1939)-C(5))-methyltransferase RlmD n=1 Tax=Oscillatoria sp. FACHB-1406 TaxID=2692846 RepID=UPI001686E45B|nr:23S rRNA (uracil(1939)-C(5))-methyltransferase RlmD [Oscillatoria sp. FACHB-1406]MBD2579867.1 23S rRNA (uracil(1939)-C(5))-methyltransferase RlmD [Oscillatoria sp. FACHB-1406]